MGTFEIEYDEGHPELIEMVADAPTHKEVPKLIKKKRPVVRANSPGLAYNGTKYRNSFKGPDYNLNDVANAVDREPLFRRSVEKLRTLILKNKFEFVGQNPNAVAYIKQRFKQISMVSGIPTDQLIKDIVEQLVTYSNAYLVKNRKKEASGGAFRRTFDDKELEPVAAYYPICATTIEIDKDEHGKVRMYRQVVPGYPRSQWPKFKPEDVIHFHKDRKVGLSTGTPYVISVLDDIRALRGMEEHVERLVYQHAVPLYQYIVGDENDRAEPEELEELQFAVDNMPFNGALVTPERHEIKVVGAEGEALDASTYLEYFMKRVRGGLHLSSVDWGEGDSSSRGTSLTMSQDTRDTVEEFQDVLKTFFNEFLLEELLAEGGFAYDEYNPNNKVTLYIPAIDIDEKIKHENHNMLMYQGGAITHEELRLGVGREPFSESQNQDTYFANVTIPTMKIKQTVSAQGNGSAQNKDTPTNQHGTQLTSPRIPQDMDISDQLENGSFRNELLQSLGMEHSSNVLNLHWDTMEKEYINIFNSPDELTDDLWIEGIQDKFVDDSIGALNPVLASAYIKGAQSATNEDITITSNQAGVMQTDVESLINTTKIGLRKLARTVSRRIEKENINDSITNDTVSAVMDTFKHRINMNISTALMRDYNFGRARMFQTQGYQELIIPACPNCVKPARTFPLKDDITATDIPPGSTHPNCNCLVTVPGDV
jgi:hypothetical protein